MFKSVSFEPRKNIIFDSFFISFQTGWNCASHTPLFSRHRIAKRDEVKTPCVFLRRRSFESLERWVTT